jgi:dGTPase
MARTEANVSAEIWSRLLSRERLSGLRDSPDSPRTSFQRDYDRIIYSSAFRRLGDKTQVYSLPYDDNVHDRLTHSLEVATVGRSLGTLVGRGIEGELGRLPDGLEARDVGDCVAAACLAHDLGNPPFGHVGEKAVREFFVRHRDELESAIPRETLLDLLHFEGNAQSLRLALRMAQPGADHGLDLTCATLAALIKYPCLASAAYGQSAGRHSRSKHGIHRSEREPFESVATRVGLRPDATSGDAWHRHPLAFLTEAADDIAYTVIDLEDGLRLGLVSSEEFVSLFRELVANEPEAPAGDDLPADRDAKLETAARYRGAAVNRLVHEAADVFLGSHTDILEGRFEVSLVDRIASSKPLELIGKTNLAKCYRSRNVLKMELAGAAAIQGVLGALLEAALRPETIRGTHLRDLLPGVLKLPTLEERLQRIVDHLSGMTDTYVVRLYRELSGVRLPGGRDL